MTELKNKQPKKRFTECEMKEYARQIAHGMNQLHKEWFVHRDIKPDNVFMTKNEEDKYVCKLGDFGTARPVNKNMEFKLEKNENINTTQAGSGFFMSPEMKSD